MDYRTHGSHVSFQSDPRKRDPLLDLEEPESDEKTRPGMLKPLTSGGGDRSPMWKTEEESSILVDAGHYTSLAQMISTPAFVPTPLQGRFVLLEYAKRLRERLECTRPVDWRGKSVPISGLEATVSRFLSLVLGSKHVLPASPSGLGSLSDQLQKFIRLYQVQAIERPMESLSPAARSKASIFPLNLLSATDDDLDEFLSRFLARTPGARALLGLTDQESKSAVGNRVSTSSLARDTAREAVWGKEVVLDPLLRVKKGASSAGAQTAPMPMVKPESLLLLEIEAKRAVAKRERLAAKEAERLQRRHDALIEAHERAAKDGLNKKGTSSKRRGKSRGWRGGPSGVHLETVSSSALADAGDELRGHQHDVDQNPAGNNSVEHHDDDHDHHHHHHHHQDQDSEFLSAALMTTGGGTSANASSGLIAFHGHGHSSPNTAAAAPLSSPLHRLIAPGGPEVPGAFRPPKRMNLTPVLEPIAVVPLRSPRPANPKMIVASPRAATMQGRAHTMVAEDRTLLHQSAAEQPTFAAASTDAAPVGGGSTAAPEEAGGGGGGAVVSDVARAAAEEAAAAPGPSSSISSISALEKRQDAFPAAGRKSVRFGPAALAATPAQFSVMGTAVAIPSPPPAHQSPLHRRAVTAGENTTKRGEVAIVQVETQRAESADAPARKPVQSDSHLPPIHGPLAPPQDRISVLEDWAAQTIQRIRTSGLH